MPCFLNGNVFRRYDRRIMVMNKDLRAHLKGQERGEAWQRRMGGGGRLIGRFFLRLLERRGGGSGGSS